MCIHSKADQDRALAYYRRVSVAALAATVAAVSFTRPNGQYGFGYLIDNAGDDQEVSNVLRNIKHWHNDEINAGWTINMDSVNEVRAKLQLAPLTSEGLPAPTGEAPPSLDDDGEVDDEVLDALDVAFNKEFETEGRTLLEA